MPQSTLISLGTSNVTSAVTDVSAGSIVTVGVFSNTQLSRTSHVTVSVKTPGADIEIGSITPNNPTMQLAGPISFVVTRPTQTGSIGAFINT